MNTMQPKQEIDISCLANEPPQGKPCGIF